MTGRNVSGTWVHAYLFGSELFFHVPDEVHHGVQPRLLEGRCDAWHHDPGDADVLRVGGGIQVRGHTHLHPDTHVCIQTYIRTHGHRFL